MGGRNWITRQKKNSSGSPARSCWLTKRYESLLPQGLLIIENTLKLFKVVNGWDEAFGLFLLKNYKSLPTGSKYSSYTDARTDDAIEPELARDKQDSIEDDNRILMVK